MSKLKQYASALFPGFIGIQGALSEWREVVVPLTAAQLIAMFTVPVVVLAAPGAGIVLQVDRIGFNMKRTATAFTGGGVISFSYHTTTTAIPHAGTLPVAMLTTAGAASTFNTLPQNSTATGLSVPVNEGIDILNITGAFATGTGTAGVYVKYRTITLG